MGVIAAGKPPPPPVLPLDRKGASAVCPTYWRTCQPLGSCSGVFRPQPDEGARIVSESGYQETNPRHWRLIDAFRELTGVRMVRNTSSNKNEPVVRSPIEALDRFLRRHTDVLVLGDVYISRCPAQFPARAGA